VPEAEDLDGFLRLVHSIENLERTNSHLSDAGESFVLTARVRCLRKAEGRLQQVVAECVRGAGIVSRK
jgi:hypothetical protein